MKHCYNCGILLTDSNKSFEHIINNCIGGKLKSDLLLCSKCNSDFGNSIDVALEKQLRAYGFLLNIPLDRNEYRGRIKLMSQSGQIKYVGPGLVPHDQIKISEKEKNIAHFFVEPTIYNKMIQKKIREIKEKYKVEYKESIVEPTKEKYYIVSDEEDQIGDLWIGGKDCDRSIVKICLNYYLHRGYPDCYCVNAKNFVSGISNNKIAFYYYPTNEIIHQLGPDEVSHIIHIRGSREIGVLYAYIELFNMRNMIVFFDLNYNGDDIIDTYCHDVIKSEDLNKSINLRLLKHHLESLPYDSAKMVIRQDLRHERLMSIIQNRQLTKR
ncbi:HNH endonuclease [Chitinophaga silvatica]|uniref:HNH endonuclease n=1 Tax=Chitinophaga silvatica TaxID=2282649 RepID=A0A3E1YHB1_9BACT|nr:HNH endonuclease [Chitinophaga silvatica]RFS26757.1 HNH endonuclease [Chitinophaga silvatica]